MTYSALIRILFIIEVTDIVIVMMMIRNDLQTNICTKNWMNTNAKTDFIGSIIDNTIDNFRKASESAFRIGSSSITAFVVFVWCITAFVVFVVSVRL